MGGMIPAIERGFPQSEIAQASYEYQREIERGEQVIVGVNKFTEDDEKPIEVLQIDESAARKQIERLEMVKRRRSDNEVAKTLGALRKRPKARRTRCPTSWMRFAPMPR